MARPRSTWWSFPAWIWPPSGAWCTKTRSSGPAAFWRLFCLVSGVVSKVSISGSCYFSSGQEKETDGRLPSIEWPPSTPAVEAKWNLNVYCYSVFPVSEFLRFLLESSRIIVIACLRSCCWEMQYTVQVTGARRRKKAFAWLKFRRIRSLFRRWQRKRGEARTGGEGLFSFFLIFYDTSLSQLSLPSSVPLFYASIQSPKAKGDSRVATCAVHQQAITIYFFWPWTRSHVRTPFSQNENMTVR